VAVSLKIAKVVGNLTEDDFDIDGVGWSALMEICVIEREVPLRVENAPERVKNRGFCRIPAPDKAEECPIGNGPI
jgi:hypothetical protein